ncbi:MAG: hypothetical protein IKF78_12410 [Atopobiaceae bacterium]|nr:hypothetical protein [Atopobiaceae bacterium]
MDIRVTEDYEVRALDSLNWQVWNLREVAKKDGTKSVEWVATGNYFTRLDGAVEFVMRHLLKKNQKQAVVTLADALDELRGIAAEIKKNMGGVTRC